MRFFLFLKKHKNAVICTVCTIVLIGSALISEPQKEALAEVKVSEYTASANAQRTAFIRSNGVACENEPFEVTDVIIPTEFNTLYQSFEALQRAQGLSLEKYKGERVKRYSYKIIDSEDFVELFITKSRIIACAVIKNNEKSEFIKLIS